MSDRDHQRYMEACRAAVESAKDKLSLADVWDLGAHAAQAPFPARGVGVVRSPLREDRTPSFSVFSGGKAFDDKGRVGVKGGVWEFVAFAREGMLPGDVARLLVERAGLRWPDKAEFAPSEKQAEDDEARAKRLREERLAQKRADQARRDRVERERRAARMDSGPARPSELPDWPTCVADRWREGTRYRDGNFTVMERLCKKRGWPVEWSDVLSLQDLVSFPVEKRYELDAEKIRRMVAFRVEAPVISEREGTADLRTVGYHQKFYDLREKRSGWQFFPSRPKKSLSYCSSFERAMLAVADERGIGVDAPMIPPLPFVTGTLARPRLVIILEGQWDALTMLGALGGLDLDGGGLASGVAVFGIRGVKGPGAFLTHWGPWLRSVKPLVWLLPDNDEERTGATWYPPRRLVDRPRGVTYFSERLGWLGARRVVVTPLRHESGGKDFNDYYRTARPSVEAMRMWMERLNLA